MTSSLRLIIILAFCMAGWIENSYSQLIKVLVNVRPPYSLEAKNYIQQGNNVVITMINTTAMVKKAKVFTYLEGINNGVQIMLNPSYVALLPLTFMPGETKVLTLEQLKNYNGIPGVNDILFQRYNKRQYFNNGTLPEGLYKACISLIIDNDISNPSSDCTTFSINGYDPPIILNPTQNDMVSALQPQNILINWTPTGMSGRTRYSLKLVDLDITPVNNPNDAFKNNVIPFFQEKNIINNTFVYDHTKPNLTIGHKYALEITAYDLHNTLLYKNNGHSQVIVFTYKKGANQVNTEMAKDSLLKNSNNIE